MDIINNKLDFTIEKNMRNTFLIIQNVKVNLQSYEAKILEEENIDKVIKYQMDFDGNVEVIKFNISGMNSLENYLKTNKLKKKDIIFIIKSIDEVLTNIENYLLSENSILLNPNTIMIKRINNRVQFYFMMIPNYKSDFSYELSKLIVKLLRFIDVNDKEGLRFAYELFVKSSKDNYTINDLLEVIPIDEDKVYDNFEEDDSFNLLDEIDWDTKKDEEIGDEFLEYLDYDNNNFNKKNEEKDGKEESPDEGICIDDATKNMLRDELFYDSFENGDLNRKNHNEKKIPKSRKKVFKQMFDLEELFNAIFVPFAAVTVPFGIFVIYGGRTLMNNFLKIFVYEIILFALFTINSFTNSRIQNK